MVMLLDVVAVQEQRQELLDKIEFIQNLAIEEKRDLTVEEAAEIDSLLAEHEGMAADEERAKAYEKARTEAAAKRANAEKPDPPSLKNGHEPEEKKLPAIPRTHGSLKAFAGPDAERDAYDAGQFVLATMAPGDPQYGLSGRKQEAWQYCVDRGLIMADAQTADDADKGGYLVPDGFSRAIIRVVDSVGIARQVADVVPMETETLTMSKRSGGLTVYAPAEAATITSSEMTWSPLALSVTDRATLTRVSIKLLRSAVTNIADRVAEEIGFAAAFQMDNEFINGDGTATYFGETGLRTAVGTAGITTTTTTTEDTWPELTLANHHTLMSTLPSKYWQSPSWICSPAYYNAVMVRLAAAAGGNTIQTIEGGATRPSFLGYPVNFTDQMPTATAVSTIHALFGNYRAAAIIGDRVGVSIASSSEVYFASGEIAIRGMWAYDINVHEPGTASEAGAYVALKTGAAA
jgi:HK97 family phage major capsid protein